MFGVRLARNISVDLGVVHRNPLIEIPDRWRQLTKSPTIKFKDFLVDQLMLLLK